MTGDQRKEWGETLLGFAEGVRSMAEGLIEDDGILGAIGGIGVAELGPALPTHIRHALIECLDDEAARSFRADVSYLRECA